MESFFILLSLDRKHSPLFSQRLLLVCHGTHHEPVLAYALVQKPVQLAGGDDVGIDAVHSFDASCLERRGHMFAAERLLSWREEACLHFTLIIHF